MNYETIITETKGKVILLMLNRPDQLNALNAELIDELGDAIKNAENNENISAIIITGNDKAFAAGADIKEMKDKSFASSYMENFISRWEAITFCRKPIIAAVAGYALGGGCELAMMCDFILAAESAKFGQPEIKLGIIPGAGGTQRLSRFVGKSKAMEMILTGRMMDADEAERCGLVSRVIKDEELISESIKTATDIANLSSPSVFLAKDSVNYAYNSALSQGVEYERKLFYSTFSLNDQKEGMEAFIEKRKPNFKNC
ncbi:MAG: putative enoyl-CoA hydratase echA8 [Alphaproteobacteria bacterium MarineAlpha2_Bin1]|nr:MAG: putative enoyl-CoA hydratase echA8 [Alphaproteobacteria bacterium MarineAlpha2_Bin1]|tara:strand:- start:1373 stop:2146 length:774 start_codon:yes stop_codon:yes gene_type:complete